MHNSQEESTERDKVDSLSYRYDTFLPPGWIGATSNKLVARGITVSLGIKERFSNYKPCILSTKPHKYRTGFSQFPLSKSIHKTLASPDSYDQPDVTRSETEYVTTQLEILTYTYAYIGWRRENEHL